MIVEVTYSQEDLRKRCFECMWLNKKDDFNGECVCTYNKVKNRYRSVTDRACSYKNFVKGADGLFRYCAQAN